jgi:hypothetical protein
MLPAIYREAGIRGRRLQDFVPREVMLLRASAKAGPDLADRKAARVLRCSPEAVMTEAQRLFKRTLAEERDADPRVRAKNLSPRSRQAVRGRVTRHLVERLRPGVAALTMKGYAPTVVMSPIIRPGAILRARYGRRR